MNKRTEERTETHACDLIDRQAAIDEVNKYFKMIRLNPEILVDSLITLPSAQPDHNADVGKMVEQRWIPVTEKLPEEKDAGILKKLGTNKLSEYVLATVEVKGERMTVTTCTYDGVWDWNMKYAFPDYKVVAWMPLPEPWKEEE